MASTVTDPSTEATEQRLVLSGIPWSQYEAVLAAFPEQAGLRMTYLDGRLTLSSPTHRHDWFADNLGNLVKTLASVVGLEWEPALHTTYRHEGIAVGVEGDQTFYLGENATSMRGPVDIDLSSQPPPDLVIEVEVTHRADDSIVVWGRLGVPELWRFDARRWTLEFLALQPDGKLGAVVESRAFPGLEARDVLEQLRIAEQIGTSRWVAGLPEWARVTLLPRRGG